MTATLPDPAQVRVGGGVILLATWCCRRRVGLPRESTDLQLTQEVACPGCKTVRRLSLISDPQLGLRAVWATVTGQPAGALPQIDKDAPAQRGSPDE